MKTRALICGMSLGLAITIVAGCAEQQPRMVKCHEGVQGEGKKVLRHVVLFKFKDGTTPEQIKGVEDAFRALPSKIEAIHGFEWGTNVSVENRSQGFTHCFLVTFLSEADRAAYLPHPDHKEFGKILGPYLDKVLVVDYWAAR